MSNILRRSPALHRDHHPQGRSGPEGHEGRLQAADHPVVRTAHPEVLGSLSSGVPHVVQDPARHDLDSRDWTLHRDDGFSWSCKSLQPSQR